jgi:copper(I)-binding protein
MRLVAHGTAPPALAALVLLALGTLTTAQADDMSLTASNAWSRPTASAAMAGVVYLTITDHGAPTKLVSVATPIAALAEMHQSLEQNGMMEMLPVKALPIAPGAPITFSPDGYHIMLTGLTQTLSAGQSFPLTLTFANGSKVSTTVIVRPMEAGAMPNGMVGGGMGGMKMSP